MNSLNDFKQDFAGTAFKTIDGDRRIFGKFGEVTILDDGIFDIWIIPPSREPIGTRRLNNLEKAFYRLKGREQARYVRLDGEAYIQATDRSLVREVALLCGVKRKRRVSESTRERLCKRLGQINTMKQVSA
jgi:hypothetical protein